MNEIQESMNKLMDAFNQRLDSIEGQLPKTAPLEPGSVAAELASFKAFVLMSFRAIQSQIAVLASQVDAVEMHGRRKILLLHGLPEVNGEETSSVVTNVVLERLKLDGFTAKNISRCHRMGRISGADRPRPILFKLHDISLRDNIWSSKTKLKGSGITLSEFLTKTRHDVFLAARQRFGVTKCWTREGCVFVLGPDGARHRVTSVGELDVIQSKKTPKLTASKKPAPAVVKEVPAVGREDAGSSKTRRAAASRK